MALVFVRSRALLVERPQSMLVWGVGWMDEDTHLHDKGDADGVGPERSFIREAAASGVPFGIYVALTPCVGPSVEALSLLGWPKSLPRECGERGLSPLRLLLCQ